MAPFFVYLHSKIFNELYLPHVKISEVFSRDVATLAITFIRSRDRDNFQAFYTI